jgi:uncharacterized membrane protein (DUF485 family)
MNELVHDRRRFTAAATLVYSLYFVAFLALLGWAPDTMTEEVAGVSLALWGGLSICALTVVFALLYRRKAVTWDRMAAELRPPRATSTPSPSASSPASSPSPS